MDEKQEVLLIKSYKFFQFISSIQRDCNLNCVSKEKNIIFTNTVFL